jgi:hypothetical protein
MGKLIPQDQLGLYGYPFSRVHIARLVRAGRLPEPIKIGYGKSARNFYDEEELLAARARAEAEARRRAADRPVVPITTGKRKTRQGSLFAPTGPDGAPPGPDTARKRGAR